MEPPGSRLCRTKQRGAPYPGSAAGSRQRARYELGRLLAAALGAVFPGLVEDDAGPALDRQLEIHARGRQVHERTGVIERQVVVGAGAELLEALRVGAVDPARSVHR